MIVYNKFPNANPSSLKTATYGGSKFTISHLTKQVVEVFLSKCTIRCWRDENPVIWRMMWNIFYWHQLLTLDSSSNGAENSSIRPRLVPKAKLMNVDDNDKASHHSHDDSLSTFASKNQVTNKMLFWWADARSYGFNKYFQWYTLLIVVKWEI